MHSRYETIDSASGEILGESVDLLSNHSFIVDSVCVHSFIDSSLLSFKVSLARSTESLWEGGL